MVADAAFPSLSAPTWPTRLTRFGLWAIGIGLLLVVISGPLNRYTGVGFTVALLMLSGGVLVLALGALLTIIGFLVGMAKGASVPKGPAAIGIVIALGMLGYLLTWLRAGMGVPPIHEISTDLASPPPFVIRHPPLRDHSACCCSGWRRGGRPGLRSRMREGRPKVALEHAFVPRPGDAKERRRAVMRQHDTRS